MTSTNALSSPFPATPIAANLVDEKARKRAKRASQNSNVGDYALELLAVYEGAFVILLYAVRCCCSAKYE